MGWERNGSIYVRTHNAEELQKIVKIANKYGINLSTNRDNDKLSSFAEEFYPEELRKAVFDMSEEVPNCLILYVDNTVYYTANAHSYIVAIKYPSEFDPDFLMYEEDAEESCPILLGDYQTPEGIFGVIKNSGNRLKTKYKAEILEIFGREVTPAILGAKNIVIENGKKAIRDGEFEGLEMRTVVIPSSVKKIGANAFANCTKLTKVVIEEGVDKIGDGAFAGCTKLKTVELPKKLSQLGKYVFQDCKALESITVPKGITKINDYAFENCYALQKVEFLDTIVGIGIRAFAKCKSLVDFEIPATVPANKIGRAAFDKATIKNQKASVDEVKQTLEGLTFVVTGYLENFPESKGNKLKKFIETRGGRLADSVTRRTNYVVCNPTPYISTELETALKNNIPIIVEEDFMALAAGKKLKLRR